MQAPLIREWSSIKSGASIILAVAIHWISRRNKKPVLAIAKTGLIQIKTKLEVKQ
jgi:hypothetical protein